MPDHPPADYPPDYSRVIVQQDARVSWMFQSLVAAFGLVILAMSSWTLTTLNSVKDKQGEQGGDIKLALTELTGYRDEMKDLKAQVQAVKDAQAAIEARQKTALDYASATKNRQM